MAKNSPRTLTIPPFPILAWDQYSWAGTVRLASWQGFQSRQGAYGSVSSRDESDGTVRLSVSPADEASDLPPVDEQALAFQHLLDNEAAIRDAILGAILAEYPSLQETYGEYAEMPPIEHPEDLGSLIGLSTVHVLPTHRDGLTCVGFEFGCTWDEEHGLGVMTYRGLVLEVGSADTSFTDPFLDDGADLDEED